MDEISIGIGNRIKGLRTNAGVTVQEAAALLNVSEKTYLEFESGKKDIRITHLVSLADYYGCTTDYILFGSEASERYQDDDLKGSLGRYSDPNKISCEKEAWAAAAKEKHEDK